jgi:ketosteroid isomerase-like protein
VYVSRFVISTLLVLAAGVSCTSEPSNDTSSNNLALIQSTYGPDIENLFNAFAPDIHWVEMVGGPYGGAFTGQEEIVANVFAPLGAEWEEFRPEPDNFVAEGNTVVVTGTYLGTNKATGKDIAARFTHVWALADGKIINFEQFTDTQAFHEATTP